MKSLRNALTVTLVLGGFSVLALVASVLALMDIGHAEPDLTLEWNVLRASFLVSSLFLIATFATLGKVYRVLR